MKLKFHPISNHRGGCDISANWNRWDLNPQSSLCKSGASPIMLLPHSIENYFLGNLIFYF